MRVARLADVPPGEPIVVSVEGREIVLVNVDGEVFALDNQCPHNGGPLGKGRLEDRAIVCPWHNWKFKLKGGRAVWPEGVWGATCYPVSVEDGQIMIRVL